MKLSTKANNIIKKIWQVPKVEGIVTEEHYAYALPGIGSEKLKELIKHTDRGNLHFIILAATEGKSGIQILFYEKSTNAKKSAKNCSTKKRHQHTAQFGDQKQKSRRHHQHQ